MAHIILMEDSPPLRRLLSRYLLDAGHMVVACESGAPSRDRMALAGADVLVTDLSMPGVDGWAVLENTRLLAPSLPVVVMTGEQVGADPRLERAFACLRKPFEEEALLSVVERALARDANRLGQNESWNESQIATPRRVSRVGSLPSLRPSRMSGRRL